MGEMVVSDKGGAKNLQVTEAFPISNKMMMTRLLHHNHHYRPLSSSSIFDNDHTSGDYGDGNGPTSCMPMTYSNHIYQVVAGSPCAHYTINASDSASVCVGPLQPLTPTSSPARATTAFKSPAAGMAASLGFPFTNAQWKELQRQAMIYKYMVASVPVPPDLLIPLTRGTPVSDNSHSPLDARFNLRLSSGADPEPGRCRRTDGKKWRCSRDVAPNHKYCERHMHRGRPRSRKPVEVHANNTSNSSHHTKKSRHEHDYNAFSSTSPVTVAISNPTISKTSSSSRFLSPASNQAYPQPPVSHDKFAFKAANFDSMASLSSDKEPRGLDWMLKDSAVSLATSDLWLPLTQTKIGLSTESSCQHSISLSNPNYEDSMFLNPYTIFSSGEQQNRDCPLFFNPDILPMGNTPHSENCSRGFIDAWSNSKTNKNNTQQSNDEVPPNGKLSLSSLNLSMGTNGAAMYEDMGDIHMGLGLMETNGGNTYNGTKSHLSSWPTPPWVSSTPGGPLAEVLRPSTVSANKDAASNPSSPVVTNGESGSPMATVASSPSGVLQKTVNSLSDSSSASSPTNASSRANSEMAMLWMSQQSKLASST